jgi:hypothetical protein
MVNQLDCDQQQMLIDFLGANLVDIQINIVIIDSTALRFARNVKRHVVIRTTNVFGWDPQTVTPNYMMGLYRALKAGKRFNAPSFLWGNPTYAEDLAKAIHCMHFSAQNEETQCQRPLNQLYFMLQKQLSPTW